MDSCAKKRSKRLHNLEILTDDLVEFFGGVFTSSALMIVLVNAFLGHPLLLWH